MINIYRLTPKAKADLRIIWNYTTEKWGENQAIQYILQIKSKFKQLADNPLLGKSRNDIKEGYRSFPEGKHHIFYR